MISLAHHPIVQDTIDRWRLELPIIPQLNESAVTKEHFRLLICMLIQVIETFPETDHQLTTINDQNDQDQKT